MKRIDPDAARGRGRRAAGLPPRRDLAEKVNPYLRPLYDALHDMMDPDKRARDLVTRGHDRGRAAGLHARAHAQRQLRHPRRGAERDRRPDEACSSPASGYDVASAVVTGDVTQVDLPVRVSAAASPRRASCSRGSRASASRAFTEVGRGASPAGAADHRGVRQARRRGGTPARGAAGGGGSRRRGGAAEAEGAAGAAGPRAGRRAGRSGAAS